jgi:hypothetical protein
MHQADKRCRLPLTTRISNHAQWNKLMKRSIAEIKIPYIFALALTMGI